MSAARAPEGAAIYAVGDIHGRFDLMAPLLEAILRDAKGARERPCLVFMGDYVDRGPQSREVLDQLVDLRSAGGLDLRFILGNHDEMMLDFMMNPTLGPSWGGFGGRETLSSYGVAPPNGQDAAAWAAASEALAALFPQSHRQLLESAAESVTLGDYFFAHAGARPGVALDAQVRSDLLWIRESFIHDRRPFEKVVVHGHTPGEAVYVDDRRIALDTGAYATGVLSAVKLWADQRRFIQAVAEPGRVARIVHCDAAGERAEPALQD